MTTYYPTARHNAGATVRTNDGRSLPGLTCDSSVSSTWYAESITSALDSVARAYGPDTLQVDVDGATYVYGSQEDADADQDGSRALCIVDEIDEATIQEYEPGGAP